MADDHFTLERFVKAQKPVYSQVVSELKSGQKRTHWMWYIFPQVQGLGSNQMSSFYAIHNLDEARAYLQHPELGSRLLECCRILYGLSGKTADEIFSFPDNLKFRSCLTLFHLARPEESLFNLLLEKYFAGALDEKTVALLAKGN